MATRKTRASKATPRPLKVAAYFRVSTKAQGDADSYGLPKQRADVEAYCALHGHQVVRTFEDIGFSGATIVRPALTEMLASEGFDAVVVPAWDRLARDPMLDGHLRYKLQDRGVAVLSATQTNGVDPVSQLTQEILRAVAGFERHLITQRLAGARRAKAAAGGFAHGRPGFGLRSQHVIGADGKVAAKILVENEAEAGALHAMRQLRTQRLTVRAIAAELNKRGHLTRKGKPWRFDSVAKILRRVSSKTKPPAVKPRMTGAA